MKKHLVGSIKSGLVPLVIIFLTSCSTKVAPPEPYGAIPTEDQLIWHNMEYISLVSYGLNAYTEQEWGYGNVDPKLFNPSNLDTDQWAEVASAAGIKGLVLVAKHHDGFCLWPSKYTDYSVKATPWRDGEGDILKDLSKSCKKYGIKLGVYLSPWDRHHAEYGRPGYIDYFHKQLEEVMTEYGEIFEFWIDGANGGTGYYGGANEDRHIDRKSYYGFDSIFSKVKKMQPNTLIFSDVGPDIRWVGNEAGIGEETNWNTITTKGKYPGNSDAEFLNKLGTGEKNGGRWVPAEVNTTLSWPKTWFYNSDRRPRSLKNLVDLYYTSIGRGSTLDLGLAIAPTGEISGMDKNALLNFKRHMDREFEVDLAKKAKITATNYRGSAQDYSPLKVIDGDTKSFWATDDGVQTASLLLEFEKKTIFNRLLLQEAIELGQRVHGFKLEIKDGDSFREVASGTTIGYKRVLRFQEISTQFVRLTFTTDAPLLTIKNLGIYNAPSLLEDPVIKNNRNGELEFEQIKGTEIYFTIDEMIDKSNFTLYQEPIDLREGGEIFSYAKDVSTGFETEIIKNLMGKSKEDWSIIGVNGINSKDMDNIIDNDPDSFFLSPVIGEQHDLVIDLGETNLIGSFGYLPRQDGNKEGVIYEYEFYVSIDGQQWGPPVAKGAFQNIENNPIRQIVEFSKAKKGRFIKLVSSSSLKNDGRLSLSEIDVFK